MLLKVQSVEVEIHEKKEWKKESATLTSPYWFSIRMTWSVRLKISRQSKSGMSGRRSSDGPLCRKFRMCLEEKGVSSNVLSMKSITDGFRIVSYTKEWDFFYPIFSLFMSRFQQHTKWNKTHYLMKTKPAKGKFSSEESLNVHEKQGNTRLHNIQLSELFC